MPGISPSFASSRKHILQSSNARMYPRFLPQRKQRRTTLLLNFGGFNDLTYVEVLDIFL